MKSLIIYSHIFSGGLVLVIGLIIMVIKKGTPLHRGLGWVYVIGMWWVCLSAFSSILIFDFSMFLLVIGIMTFYFTFSGVRVMRRGKAKTIPWYDYAVSLGVWASGLGLIIYALYVAVYHTNHILLAGLSLVFGIFITYGTWRDLLFFRKGNQNDPNWWLYQHIGAMGGSYVSAVSAFAVQNGDYIGLPGSISWMPWVIPGVLGGYIIAYVIKQHKRKTETIKISPPIDQ
jgi:uncharacterized membrane protein